MAESLTIDQTLADERLLGAALGDIETWQMWLVVLRAMWGLELNRNERRAFAKVAGSRAPPEKRVREMWAIIGRRGGKSRIAALICCYVALFVPHRLAPGEKGLCLILAATTEQAKVTFGYCEAFLRSSPVLSQEIVDATSNEIRLRNGVTIAVHPSNFRSVRGRTLLVVVFDEVSFWPTTDSAQPDHEVYSACLPSLATCNGLLVGISSPFRKIGLLHSKYKKHFGVDGDDVLVVQGGSQVFNSTLTDAVIAAQREADPTAASSEWDARFRADIGSLFDDALIDAAVEYGRPLELPPRGGVYYKAFTDASGGVGADSYTVSVGHREGDLFIIDLVRGTSGRFDPQETTKEYAALLHEYGVTAVQGDFYGAEWVGSAWRATGVSYVRSEAPKSGIYLECIPLFTRGLVRLPDHPKLLRELRLLERHTHRSGRDSVDHPRSGSDDYANSCCGVLKTLATPLSFFTGPGSRWLDDDADADAATVKQREEVENRQWRVHQMMRASGIF